MRKPNLSLSFSLTLLSALFQYRIIGEVSGTLSGIWYTLSLSVFPLSLSLIHSPFFFLTEVTSVSLEILRLFPLFYSLETVTCSNTGTSIALIHLQAKKQKMWKAHFQWCIHTHANIYKRIKFYLEFNFNHKCEIILNIHFWCAISK